MGEGGSLTRASTFIELDGLSRETSMVEVRIYAAETASAFDP